MLTNSGVDFWKRGAKFTLGGGGGNRNSSPNLRIRTRMYDRVILGHMAIT